MGSWNTFVLHVNFIYCSESHELVKITICMYNIQRDSPRDLLILHPWIVPISVAKKKSFFSQLCNLVISFMNLFIEILGLESSSFAKSIYWNAPIPIV